MMSRLFDGSTLRSGRSFVKAPYVAFDKDERKSYLLDTWLERPGALRLKQNGDSMKKYVVTAILFAAIIACSAAHSAPPIFKEKKYFGPVPYNSLSFSAGFLDGPDFKYLTEHFNNWARDRHGFDNFEEVGLSPYGRLSYERQLTPNHFLKMSSSMSYIKTTSLGNYVAQYPDTNYSLDVARTFKVYLLTFEAGFSYYFATPAAQTFSPYAGAGFAAVVPMARLDTKSTLAPSGEPFANAGENISQNSLQAGLHMEFGMTYFMTDRYAMGLEGKYQMMQSKFRIHGGNFDLNYAGFVLSLNLIYYL